MTGPNSIAVIGMSGRWPGARNTDEFWSNLCGGIESIRAFTEAELQAAGINPAVLQQPAFVNAGAPLDDSEMFDAAFFGITHREAQSLDPQRRVFLECAWHALEDAAYAPEYVDGPIGLYAGSSLNSYMHRVNANPELVAAVGSYQVMIGNDKDHLTTYAAYKLNLTGPAVTVQTACSTSLVSVAMACQSLLNQECDLALAGGVSIRMPQHFGYFYEEGGILSPDGHCRAFDAGARGTVGGNGVGAVVLKRAADAVRDRDRIRAFILGCAINNDGSMKVGYTAPSVEGQAAVIATAMTLAGVEPESLGYVEAHGTATPLGDPIEIAGLTQAFGTTKRRGFCAIGSVKSNIGHLDAAAGVTGLIKAVMCVERGLLPPSLHFQAPNPSIDFASSPFYVQSQLSVWDSPSSPRRAAVSAFGIGGTNAHVILEEPPKPSSSGGSRPYQILPLSARSEAALNQVAEILANDLNNDPSRNLADVAFTLAAGRRALPYRRVLISPADHVGITSISHTAVASDQSAPVFLFPGQGSQHVGMGRDLYENENFFRQEFACCADLFESHLGVDLRRTLFDADARDDQLRQTWLAQPALFAVEYALARLLMSWGITPAAMIGHSLGEYVAACLAGVFSLEDAVTLVAARGMLMQETAVGAMLAVALPENELRPLLPREVEIAAVNGPAQTVLSGPETCIEGLQQSLAGQDAACVRLRTSHAFHSAAMDPVLGHFRALLQSVELHPPTLPYIENRGGTWQKGATDPSYWVDHLRHAVRFGDGCRTLCDAGFQTFIEVGPGSSLSKLLGPYLREAGAGVAFETGLDQKSLLTAVGRLWTHGVALDWQKYFAGEERRRVSLPLYPFEWQRYDAEPTVAPVSQINWFAKNPDLTSWFYEPCWKGSALPQASPGAAEGPWLLFLDDSGLGAAVAERLQNATIVKRGTCFDRIDEHALRMRPEEPSDYESLFGVLRDAGAIPARILHFWNVDPAPADTRSVFYPLVFLAQTLATGRVPSRVNVISTGAWAVTGEETIEPAKAVLAGPCRVAPMEQAGLQWRNIDVTLAPGTETSIVEQVLAECRTDSTDTIVAYRGRRRWTETVEPVSLPPDSTQLPLLRSGGVYLITGGLGGVGLAIAEFLAREYQARLVLVGRTPLPEDSPKRAILAAMEEAGGAVLVCSADVANADQMNSVMTQTRERFGALHGVIHSAGVAGGGLIQLKDRATADAVLSPKIQGTLVLDSLLRDAKLDFFATFSSLTSLLGGLGQVDYCSANSFLDAFAQGESGRRDRNAITINWDAWAEVGMAVNTAIPSELEAQRAEVLRNAILPAEGVEAFRRALHSRLPQVCVSAVNLPLRILQSRMLALGASAAEATPAAPAQRHPRPDMRTPFAAAVTEMERLIERIWEDLFGLGQVGTADDFFDLGGHSLLATQMATRVRSAIGLEIGVRDIFESPTIAQLAARLERMADESAELTRMIELVEQMSDDQVKSQLEQS